MDSLKSALLSSACVLLAAVALPAQAVTINDVYTGANDHGYGDVIGTLGSFAITDMDVTRSGNTLTVVINTSFAGMGDDGLFSGYTNTTAGDNKGIGYGDLFLASTWGPYGSSPYVSDDNTNGTQWLYGFSLDDRWMANGSGTGTLYSLNGADNDANTLLSEDFMSGATYRNGQEIAVDTASSDTASVGGGNSSSWSVNDSTVTFNIDLTGTSLADTNESFAFHWAMTCANDVIEGEANLPQAIVPVPPSVWLMGTGLLGLVGIARRRKLS